MAAELEARLRGMALDDVGGGISGANVVVRRWMDVGEAISAGKVEVVRRWIEAGGNVGPRQPEHPAPARGPVSLRAGPFESAVSAPARREQRDLLRDRQSAAEPRR